jgi:two-component system, LuxR family, sensor kinase FixL
MSWVTIIWAMIASACLTLALVHVLVWWRRREALATLLFALTAVATAVLAGCELRMMRAATPEAFGLALRWGHAPVWLLIVSLVGFVRLYLRAGRRWLAWTVCGVRTLSLILNFVFTPNLNYREITALRPVSFLGETVVVAEGVPNPWMLIGQLSLLLLVIFVADAAITVWQRGDRRQALLVGGSMVFFVLDATGQASMALWGIIHVPITASLFYMSIVAVMGYELSQDVFRAASLSDELRESREQMALATDAANLAMWAWDVFKDEVWMTDKGRALFGFARDTRLDYAKLIARVHSEDRVARTAAIGRAIDTQGEYNMEYRVLLPDGTQRWIDARGNCMNVGDAKGFRLLEVSLDVTSQKQAQDRFRLVVESSPDGIVLFDAQGHIVLVNARVEKMYGYGREELTGQRIELLVPERFRSEHPAHGIGLHAVPAAQAAGAGLEVFARRKDGTEFPVEIGISPIQSQEGALVLGVIVDISARKRAEAEARQHREELAHLSRVGLVGEMAGSLAHELNQPLTGIVNNASAGRRFIAKGRADLSKLDGLLEAVVADGRRAGEIIRGIRGMVRKGEEVRGPVNLNDVIASVLRFAGSDALGRRCALITELDPELPLVEADLVQLQQVLLNLVVNALDAMRETSATERRMIIRSECEPDGRVRVSVRDFGTGLPANEPQRIFEQFFSTKREGMGMGLAIARSIITSHGGELAAENAQGGGACVHFSLPVIAEGRRR